MSMLAAGIIGIALVVYALTGGADFGSGVWTLLASGKRRKEQRDLIEHAIAPIWEANHVWLILVVVLLFVAFPKAFALICTQLHIPLTVMLIGIVLRGSAFVFSSYGPKDSRWPEVFAWASVLTPICLGVTLGAVASGRVTPDAGFISPWAHAFAFIVGAFVLALFSLLAATYLTVEAKGDLAEDFRTRALASEIACGVIAGIGVFAAPPSLEGLRSIIYQLVTGAVALAATFALFRRAYRTARVLVIAQVALVIGGFLIVQAPHLVPPTLTIENAAADAAVIEQMLIVLGCGALLLAPAFFYLFFLFKRNPD